MKRTGRTTAMRVGGLLLLLGLAAARPGAEGNGERVEASGTEVSREFQQQGFERVRISQAFEARLRHSDRFQVTVHLDEAWLTWLEVARVGDTLSVGFRQGFRPGNRAVRPRVEIALPRLRALELSGAVQADVEGFRSESPLDLELSGASLLRGRIEAGDLRLDASGASRLQLEGGGRDARLELSGASEADLWDFSLQNVEVDISGASTARVQPAGRLDAEASGASRVLYSGSPVLGRIELSGSSTVTGQ